MKKVLGIMSCVFLLCEGFLDARPRERVIDTHKTPLFDRSYYNSLIKYARKRRWAVTVSSYYDREDKGFDDRGNTVPLSTIVFGSCPITIEDIYLFSRLSNGNKVRIDNCNARVHDRGGVPIGGTGIVFGGFSDDLYTTLLAPIVLNFLASQKTFRCEINGIARFDCSRWEHCSAALGFTLPLKSCHHELSFSYSGGELFRWGFVPDTTQRETSLKQFFREFSSVEDFINSAVLAPYCLSLKKQQQRSGIGDLALFGILEYHHDHTLELGCAVVLPTASKGGTLFIWQPELGNGGAYLFNPFVQLLCTTNNPYFNPFVRVAAEIGSSFHTNTTRAPTLVTNPIRQQVHVVSALSAPDTFENFYVDPFQEYDSTVPLISGKTPTMRKKIGSKVLLGLGNYVYNLFHLDFRLGMFYDFFAKGADSYCGTSDCVDGAINTTSLETKTNQHAHILSANLVYKFKNYVELGLGGQYTIYGKNIAKNRGVYFSFVAVF